MERKKKGPVRPQEAPRESRRPGRPRLGEADKAFTEDELRVLLEHLARLASRERRRRIARGPRARDELVVQLLAMTGLRASELARLRVADVHLARRKSYLRVRGGKKRHRRDVSTVPIPWVLVEPLEKWTRNRPARGFLFHASRSLRGLIRQEVWRIVKRGIRAAELREVLNAHSLRHYYVTQVARKTRSSAMVMKLARLRTLELADHYTHIATEDCQDVVGPMRLPKRRAR